MPGSTNFDNYSDRPLPVYKQLGETPLQCLRRVCRQLQIPPEVKVTYAGRLDPMAEGVMLLLIGNERFNKESYTSLPKEYLFDILWGVNTDTGDVLGLPQQVFGGNLNIEQSIVDNAYHLIGDISLHPPRFSTEGLSRSRYLQGNDRYPACPEKKVMKVSSLEVVDSCLLPPDKVEQIAIDKVSRVQGDFRQLQIKQQWRQLAEHLSSASVVTRLRMHCSAGTYVRSVVEELAGLAGVPAVVWHIYRPAVGTFTIYNCY